MCLRLLARLNYIMGDYQEALFTQHKAVMMSERVLGIDHPQTATEYVSKGKKCSIRNDLISNRFIWLCIHLPMDFRLMLRNYFVERDILS